MERVSSCPGIRDRLSAFIDDELSEEQDRAVEEHLDACAGCAAEVEALVRVDVALAAAPRLELRPGLLADAVRFASLPPVAAPTPKSSPIPLPNGWTRWTSRRALVVGSAGTAAAAVIVAVLASSGSTRSSEVEARPVAIAAAPALPPDVVRSVEDLPLPAPSTRPMLGPTRLEVAVASASPITTPLAARPRSAARPIAVASTEPRGASVSLAPSPALAGSVVSPRMALAPRLLPFDDPRRDGDPLLSGARFELRPESSLHAHVEVLAAAAGLASPTLDLTGVGGRLAGVEPAELGEAWTSPEPRPLGSVIALAAWPALVAGATNADVVLLALAESRPGVRRPFVDPLAVAHDGSAALDRIRADDEHGSPAVLAIGILF